MSEDTVAEEPQDVEEPEDPDAADATPAAAEDDKFTLRALVVGAVSFVVVLSMVIAVYIFKVGGAPAAMTAPEEAAEKPGGPEGDFTLVMLLENGLATMPIGPHRETRVAYRYTIYVKVNEGRKALLDKLIENGMPKVKEQVRKIIIAERPARLHNEQLDGVKRQIAQQLNLLMEEKVVEEVVFDMWTPI